MICPYCTRGFNADSYEPGDPSCDVLMIKQVKCERCEGTGIFVPASTAGLASKEPKA